MAEVRFENVTKSFDGVEVIKNLDLTIYDGEFFTFVGPSGCGKSTILNLVAGLEGVTHGHIYFDGQEVNLLSPKIEMWRWYSKAMPSILIYESPIILPSR